MTVPSQTSRDAQAGNGVTLAFTVPFRILEASHLRVLLTVAGVTTEQVLDSDYTVSGVGGSSTTVTFVTAPASGSTITFLRNVPFTQETDYVPNDPFPAESHERALDKLTMQVQQLNEVGGENGRTIKIPPEVSGVSTTMPAPAAGALWGWNVTGTGPRYYTVSEIGTTLAFSNFIADKFTATAGQTDFILTADPGALANLDVSIDGVTKVPATDYTLDGTTLTLNTAMTGGEKVLARYGTALPVGVIDASSVNFSHASSYGQGTVGLALQGALNAKNAPFNAVGDGVADDTAALQAALDEGKLVLLPAGIYKVTSELAYKRGSRLIGAGNWSGTSSWDIDTGTTVIRYAGAGGANSCVIRMATQPVGTEPTNPATRELMNVALCDIVIDGGGLAEIGVYMVRAWSNNPIEFVTVTNTRKHGFLALQCWNGSPRNWHAYKNLGCGITLGKNVFGWSSSNVDQSTCTSFFGYYSGYDFNTVAQNTFNETTAPADSYGIGVFDARALVMINAQANECGGPGIYVENTHWPLTFVGGYAENNGKATASTAQWDIWIKGVAAGSSWGIQFDGMRLGGTPAIRLTGSAPSRDEMGVTFRRIPFIGTIKADWGTYRLVDCDRNAVFSATAPNGFVQQFNGGRNLSLSGTAVFDASAGSISLLNKEGIVSAVNYIAVGTYEVVLSQTFSSPRYGVTYSGGDNRLVGIGTIANGSFRVFNRTTAGALTDSNSRITVNVTGYYQ